jgi:16S rRNA (cytosine967-C5)-methyltransferase
MSPADTRARAARAVAAVHQGRPGLEISLTTTVEPLLAELAYGTCRRYYSLRTEVDTILDRPLRKRDQDLYALMLVGAYQLRYTRIPDYAAVSETVAAAKLLHKPWARQLINGVLRNLARKRAASSVSELAGHDHPDWLIKKLNSAHPDACPELFTINNSRAPMSLSINIAKTSTSEYTALLDSQGLGYRPGLAPNSIVLTRPLPVAKLPGFSDGWVSVQDEGAQLAAELLAPPTGASVLDACAAPGGKAFNLLARDPSLKLTALDRSERRLGVVRRDAMRLGHRLENVLLGDATKTSWWNGRPYDAILLDAPCSGSGTLRRNPDIKIRRQPLHVVLAAKQQRALLNGMWPMLSTGGTLLYCTCSILPEENEQVVSDFLESTPDAVTRGIRGDWGRAAEHGRLLLPSIDGPDGFYFALLEKISSQARRAPLGKPATAERGI